MTDPWLTKRTYDGIRSAWIDTQSRLDAAKRFDAARLRACIAWPDTQKAVRKFCERRLRKMQKTASDL